MTMIKRLDTFDPDFLLLMEGRKRQRKDPGLLPAWDRYDTPLFRDLRTWRDAGRILPQILILSPVHGLIEPTEMIEAYDSGELRLEDDVADMIVEDPDNRDLFRRYFTTAQHTLCVTEKKANLIFRRWLEASEHYQYEARGLSKKREILRRFLESVPQHTKG
jgi:hypothetical protein